MKVACARHCSFLHRRLQVNFHPQFARENPYTVTRLNLKCLIFNCLFGGDCDSSSFGSNVFFLFSYFGEDDKNSQITLGEGCHSPQRRS